MKVKFIFVNDWCANVSSLLFCSVFFSFFESLYTSCSWRFCLFSPMLIVCVCSPVPDLPLNKFCYSFWWISFLFFVIPASLTVCCLFYLIARESLSISRFVSFIFRPSVSLFSWVAWEGASFRELHVVGYVYQELWVCTAHFTYIYAKSLSALYRLCLLYKQIQRIE